MQLFSTVKLSSFVRLPVSSQSCGQRHRRALIAITTCQSIEPIYTLAELNNQKQQTMLNFVNETCDNFFSNTGNWINLIQFGETEQNQLPQPVIDAFNEVVTKQVGSLRKPFFDVSIRVSGQVCKQQLEQQLSTGILVRNLERVVKVREAYQSTDAAVGSQDIDCASYAPGSQTKHVQGYVIKWDQIQESVVIIDAKQYIKSLEQKLEQLEGKVEQQEQQLQGERAKNDGLLDVLKNMEREERMQLTEKLSPEIEESMTHFVSRLVQCSPGFLDQEHTFDAQEFAKILFLAIVVGYGLRHHEQQYDLEYSMLEPSEQNVFKSIDVQGDDHFF
eukprot:TRINITY_DN10355_c1_g1_i1.p1 TRINITY_DN10355_c1_g1~~TRINITY_DN10355_c1_g1_i1.p1  ORF type:complete len:332 (+),score=31.45 TRINITY_DN10355_c1_g1_i1:116-1111(+)